MKNFEPIISSDPLCIEVTRGSAVESEHEVSFALADQTGKILSRAGEIEAAVYPRSAIKPVQSLALCISGAAKAFSLTDVELALACASHNGEQRHVEAVEAWLQKIDLDPSYLECGCQNPSLRKADIALANQGRSPGPEHNNCSGKHSGFLTLARHENYPLAGYIEADHPVQQRVKENLEIIFGMKLDGQDKGIDGCGIPTIALPLHAMATGFARFTGSDILPEEQQAACARLVQAIRHQPYFIAGTAQLCTDIIEATKGQIIAKRGAEGVYGAMFMGQGLGLSLKVKDGARRGAEAALMGLLEKLSLCDPGALALIQAKDRHIQKNWTGTVTGHIRLRT